MSVFTKNRTDKKLETINSPTTHNNFVTRLSLWVSNVGLLHCLDCFALHSRQSRPSNFERVSKNVAAAIASPRLAQTTKNLACLLGSSKRATRAELVFLPKQPNILPFALPFCLQQQSPDMTMGSGQSSS